MRQRAGQQQTITSLPIAPTAERRGRVKRYSITMGIRVVCFLLCLVVPGYWKIAFVVGAVVLPYIAVVVANVGSGENAGEVERPGGIVAVRTGDGTGYGTSSAAGQGYGDAHRTDGHGEDAA